MNGKKIAEEEWTDECWIAFSKCQCFSLSNNLNLFIASSVIDQQIVFNYLIRITYLQVHIYICDVIDMIFFDEVQFELSLPWQYRLSIQPMCLPPYQMCCK